MQNQKQSVHLVPIWSYWEIWNNIFFLSENYFLFFFVGPTGLLNLMSSATYFRCIGSNGDQMNTPLLILHWIPISNPPSVDYNSALLSLNLPATINYLLAFQLISDHIVFLYDTFSYQIWTYVFQFLEEEEETVTSTIF